MADVRTKGDSRADDANREKDGQSEELPGRNPTGSGSASETRLMAAMGKLQKSAPRFEIFEIVVRFIYALENRVYSRSQCTDVGSGDVAVLGTPSVGHPFPQTVSSRRDRPVYYSR